VAKLKNAPVWQFCKWALVLIFGFALFAELCLPRGGSREPARRTQCLNRIRNVALALHNYHSKFGSLPPAYIPDEKGRPMYSWRVLILPYLDRADLYDAYRFDQPWNGPDNSKLHDIIVEEFCCPEDHGRVRSTESSYVAIVGPETLWPGNRGTKLDDVTDSLSETLLVVEVANSGIHWMEPRDLDASRMPKTINDNSGMRISSMHPGIAVVAFADGRVRTLTARTPATTVEAMMASRGGEVVPERDR
jgi:hypothetical protein